MLLPASARIPAAMRNFAWLFLALLAMPASADVFINAGGPAQAGYIADRYYAGGDPYTWWYQSGIYRTERYSSNKFSYAIPVTPGQVQVTLKFRESCDICNFVRKFNVTAEGQPVLSNFVVAVNSLSDQTFIVTSDATLNLTFTAVTGEVYVNAIEVRQLAGGGAPAPTVSLSASPPSIASGGSSTLTWSSANATSCTASGGWSGPKPVSGSQLSAPITATTTFALSCTGAGGTVSTSAVVAVVPTPTLSLIASPTTVAAGNASTLQWSTANAASCTASGGWTGAKATSGSQSTGAIVSTTTFTLTCTGPGGTIARNATVTVAPAPQVSLSSSPTSVASGAAATLTWTSTNASSCSASGGWSGAKTTNGSQTTGPLAASTSYTLTCSGTGGSKSATTAVTVDSTPIASVTLSASPQSVTSGGSTTLTWSSNNATSCLATDGWSGNRPTSGSEAIGSLTATTSFSLTCSNAVNSDGKTVTVAVTQPQVPAVVFTASPSTVANGNSSLLSWSSTNATSCTASGAWSGSQLVSGSASTGPLTSNASYTLACTGAGGTTTKSVSIVVSSTASLFPLHTVAGTRYLLDTQGNPFLIQGDSAWSLMVQLTDAEVDQYLDNRQAKGFNTLLVSLLERYFADNAPKNANGDGPFLTPNDFSTPNEAYFAHAASVIQKAADRNMLVLLTPAYLGYSGGSEGWYQAMQNNGATKLRAYGQYLANRFSAYSNIVWVHGGDYNPPNLTLVNAVANGIRDVNTTWLHTYHGAEETSPVNIVGTSSWLNINNVYSYDSDVSSKVSAQYNASTMPLFLIESLYEGTGIGTAQYTRSHAYQALLSGASGQIFGNNPIWHFDAPHTVYSYTGTWTTAVNGQGSISMQKLHDLWISHPWWLLQPRDSLVSSGHAALASDGSYALAYLTGNTTVRLSDLASGGTTVNAKWYNPFTGAYTAAGTFPTSGTRTFTTPGNNGSGTDWILVIEIAP